MNDMQLLPSRSDTTNDIDIECGTKNEVENGIPMTTVKTTTTVGELATLLHDLCVILADGGGTIHNTNNKNMHTNKNKNNKNKKNYATKDSHNYDDDHEIVPSLHTASYFVPSLIQSIVKVLRQKNRNDSNKRDNDIDDDNGMALSSGRGSGDDSCADNDDMLAVLNGLWGYTRITGIVPPPPPPSKLSSPVTAEAAATATEISELEAATKDFEVGLKALAEDASTRGRP